MLTQFSSIGHAQYLTGPVASGAGGAGRAATEDGEQFIHNPAAVVDSSQAVGTLFYSDGFTAYREQDNYYGATVTDNTPGLLCAGAYVYAHRKRSFENLPTVTEDFHQLSLGQFALTHLSLGAAVTYLRSVIDGGESYIQWNGHLGVLYNPTPNLGLAFVSYNAFGRMKNLPAEVQEVNKLAIGTNYILLGNFHLRADVSQVQIGNPKHLNEYQFGFESQFRPMLWARIGYDRDELANRRFWTAGLTFDGPKLKIDYFFRQNFDYGSGAMHGVDLRLPFW